MRLLSVCGVAAAGLLLLGAPPAPAASLPLEQGFREVPLADRPWVYWWWLNGNVDRPTITRDLEAMRRVGIGGLLLFDARGYHDDQAHVVVPPPRMEFMSAEWREMLKFTLQEASRLGLEVSVNLSRCAGALVGPWVVGDDMPKKLVWTATEMQGPQFNLVLAKPEGRRFWEVALLAVRHDDAAATHTEVWQEVAPKSGAQPLISEVLDLTARVDKAGRLTVAVPPGRWTLLRFGCMTMEGDPAHAGQRVTEHDVDVLDPEAVERHFVRMGRTMLRDAGPLAGKTLTHFYSVSWEGAIPTWTRRFEQEYTRRRGYDLRPWLPALAGFTVRQPELTERFRRDYYQTLGDCFRDNFYGTLRRLSNQAGLRWHSESGGPWNRRLASFAEADQLAFLGRNDMPQGEFWFTGRAMNRPAAMAARQYGQRLAATEAFTHMLQHWSAYPAALKPHADAAFCDGINHFIWHTFTCSPPEFGLPGSEYFAGTHFNPNVTWFPQAGPFVTYLARCQYLLRQGLPVVDVCVYVGDKPYQHWGRGTNWSERATLRLPPGYAYDLLSTEVLRDRLQAKAGGLALPGGMSYRLLVVDLDEECVPPEVLRKITALQRAGATVVFGRRQPQRAPGLANFPACDEEVRRLAARLWPASPTLEQALQARQPLPDLAGPADFTHRRTPAADIYFVAGRGADFCTFRVQGKLPELWDPVSGTLRPAAEWRAAPGGAGTLVSLAHLPTNGSVFVVFRQPAHPPTTAPAAPLFVEEIPLPGPWRLTFEPGRGAPDTAEFAQLRPWNEHPDERIRYFSGKATYRQTFELAGGAARRARRLHLGEVHCLARVRLNGRDLGIVWTAPWSVDLGEAAQPGRNELEIEVVNTWVNRLIGDAGLPVEQRITKSNLALQPGPRTIKVYQGFASSDPLMRSGLLGPVRLELGP